MTIKEKIKQIIAKAASTTSEAEAESLMAKAVAMMEKHQIEAHELGADDPLGTDEGDFRPKSGPSSYRPRVNAALARYYGCKVFWHLEYKGKHIKQRLEISGPESARVTTALMMDFVWSQIVEKAAKLAEDGHGKRDQMIRHICNSMVGRLNQLVAEQRAKPDTVTQSAANALTVIGTSLDAYYDKKYPNRTTRKGGVRRAAHAAQAAASGISLHRQAGGATVKRIGG